MREVNKTPTAINEPLHILGINFYEIAVAIMCAFFLSHWGLKAAAIGFLIPALIFRYAEGKDTRWHKTVRRAVFFKRIYDPISRNHFETRIQ